MEPPIDLNLLFSRFERAPRPGAPRQLRLYQLIREAILDGTLAAGTRLPGTRALAAELGIARNSVLYAYERLGAEGFLGATRHGTRVLRQPRVALAPASRAPKVLPSARARQLASVRTLGADDRAFGPGFPDCSAFPRKRWLSCLHAAWQRAGPAQLGYGAATGEPALRQAIADYLRSARGVRCSAEQVLVTAGSQSGLDACARILADPGCTAWVENPGYLGARSTFGMAGHAVHPIAVDADGMAPRARDWQRHAPKVIHVTPSLQFPLGVTLSLERRLELIRRAAACRAWIIEDDYDSEFRYEGRPLTAMQGLIEDAPVIYLGTFSRMMFPALRIGYMVVPAALTGIFNGMAQLTWPGHAVEQGALAQFIARGYLAVHLRRMRKLYGERREQLLRSLARHLGGMVRIVESAGGLQLTAAFDPALRVADTEVARAADGLGLSIRPLSVYAVPASGAAGFNGMVLGFASVGTHQIDGAVRKLQLAIAAARRN